MQEEYRKAISRLLLDHPFFGALSLRLTPVEDDSIETACTNGVNIRYNPKWFLKLKPPQRAGLLAHEVMHVALLHMLRREGRNPKRWNIAADFVINGALVKSGLVLPHTELLDSQYDGMSTEQVYELLPEDIGQNPKPTEVHICPGDDPGGCGGVEDHPDILDGQATGKYEADLEVAIYQAAEAAKSIGKLPGHMQTLIEKALAPKVDWKMVLARFLRANNKSDFTWIRPNRRLISSGLYLPSLHNPCLSEIAIVTDSSGSVQDAELQQFTGETSSILHDLNPELIHFIQCDSEVQNDTTYTREDLPLTVEYEGRGGTAFSPAIEYINEKYPNIAALIYLTDLEATDFGKEPHYPVLWVTTAAEEAPYGEVIKIN